MNESDWSVEFLELALAEHNRELATDVSANDFGAPSRNELRSRHEREQRARRRGSGYRPLRQLAPPLAPASQSPFAVGAEFPRRVRVTNAGAFQRSDTLAALPMTEMIQGYATQKLRVKSDIRMPS